MTVYAVFKEGIYRHECAGVFSDLEAAKAVADGLLAIGDGYHSWRVVPFELDRATPRGRRADDLDEPRYVYEAQLTKARP